MTAVAHAPAVAATPRGLTAEQAPSLILPGEHFAAALLFLVAGAVGLIWAAPDLAAGLHASMRVAAVTHLFTLGWLTTTILGALYQLLPVALGARVPSERVAHASFIAFAPGVALVVGGIAALAPAVLHAGLGLVTIGIGLALASYVRMLPKAMTRDVTWWALVIALGYLVLGLALGFTLGLDLTRGFLAGAKLHVLAMHFHIAALGFVLLVIVGMAHRLLPMFLVAHGADLRWSRRAVGLIAPGLLVLCAGLDLDVRALAWAGAAMLEGGVACFYVQVARFYQARRRPTLDAGLRHVRLGLASFAAAAVLAPVVLAAGATHPRLATVYVALGIGGGLSLFVVGMFYKIVPFLAWIARFRDAMGRRAVPTIAELYSARVARIELRLYTAAIAILAAGIAAGVTLVVRAGALLFAAATVLVAWQMAGVMRRESA